MGITWRRVVVDGDPLEPSWHGDPALLLDAVATLMLTAKRPPWMKYAACRGLDPAAWFRSTPKASAPAVAVCQACPVRDRCLTFALERDDEGIWAGLNQSERRKLKRDVA